MRIVSLEMSALLSVLVIPASVQGMEDGVGDPGLLDAGVEKSGTPPALIESKLKDWFDHWRKWLPDLTGESLRRQYAGPYSFIPPYPWDPDRSWVKLKSRTFIPSPDSSMLLDPYVTMEIFIKDGRVQWGFDVDVGVGLADLKAEKFGRILYTGPSMVYEEAAWLADSIVVVAGREYVFKGDPPLYRPDSSFYVLTLDIIDLGADSLSHWAGPRVGEAEFTRMKMGSYISRKMASLYSDDTLSVYFEEN